MVSWWDPWNHYVHWMPRKHLCNHCSKRISMFGANSFLLGYSSPADSLHSPLTGGFPITSHFIWTAQFAWHLLIVKQDLFSLVKADTSQEVLYRIFLRLRSLLEKPFSKQTNTCMWPRLGFRLTWRAENAADPAEKGPWEGRGNDFKGGTHLRSAT